jgi:predicted DsbA family dithiol-disulfide isomerase
LAHEATAYAKEQGLDSQFHRAAARAYWLAGADLGSLYVLRDLSLACGLDWQVMRDQLESHHYRDFVNEEHDAAVRRGVTGTPSYLIGGRMYAGDVSIEALREAIENTQ